VAARKKNAARLGAYLVFVDESGFMLIPPVRRTWAPQGRTPIHRHHYRRDRISVIAGVSVSPKRQRLGLFFRLHATNIGHDEVYDFLWWLLKHLPGHIILLWDNASIHRDGPVAELCAQHQRLHLEYFPAYAPELNPAEGVWSQAKASLANGRPDNIEELGQNLVQSFAELRCSRRKLHACITQSELPSFLC
jgi:putative transposase